MGRNALRHEPAAEQAALLPKPPGRLTCDGEGCTTLNASIELQTESECVKRRLPRCSSGDSRR